MRAAETAVALKAAQARGLNSYAEDLRIAKRIAAGERELFKEL